MEEHLYNWEYYDRSPSGKTPDGETRWEVYSPLSDDRWLMTVLGVFKNGEAPHIVTAFVLSAARFERRRGRLSGRKEGE
jgi:hypothetical protein